MENKQVIEFSLLGEHINPKLSRHYVLMQQYLTDEQIQIYLTFPGFEAKLDNPRQREIWIKLQEFQKTPIMQAHRAKFDALHVEAQASNPLRVLGLATGASKQEIRNAYRRLARKAHPDHGGSEAEMKRINAAYVALCPKAKAY